MAIISNFPTERDWNKVIEALAVEIMSGSVQLPIETQDGEALNTRTGVQLGAYKKDSYSDLAAKPKINGVELGENSSSEALGLVNIAALNALIQRVVELEAAVLEFKETGYLISRDPE